MSGDGFAAGLPDTNKQDETQANKALSGDPSSGNSTAITLDTKTPKSPRTTKNDVAALELGEKDGGAASSNDNETGFKARTQQFFSGPKAGHMNGTGTKIAYTILLVLAVVLALIAKFGIGSSWAGWFIYSDCHSQTCVGNNAAYRVSFGVTVFFFVQILLVLASPQAHFTHWISKFIMYIAFIILSFLIPTHPMMVYAEIARVVSFFFLLLQILLLINLVHELHESLLATMSGEGEDSTPEAATRARRIYLALFILLTSATIAGTVLIYYYYGKCDLTIALVTVCLILCVISYFLSIIMQQGALTPSLVAAYGTFLSFQATTNNPYESCGVFQDSQPIWILIVAAGIAAISLGWNAIRAADSTPVLFNSGKKTEGEDNNNASSGNENGGNGQQPSYWSFHLVLMTAAMYIAMLTTGWGSSDPNQSLGNSEASAQSMWTKWASQWLLFLLYFWTLMAPKLFPDRDFSA